MSDQPKLYSWQTKATGEYYPSTAVAIATGIEEAREMVRSRFSDRFIADAARRAQLEEDLAREPDIYTEGAMIVI